MLPSAPSQTQNYTVPELPGAGPVMTPTALRGRVTEAAPTSIMQIYPAVVTIVDGEYAGRSAQTDFGGFYEISGLRPGTFTVAVEAEGFVRKTEQVNFGVEQTANFALLPIPETLRYVLPGDIRGSDGTCSDGVNQRPCRIIAFPIHNSGQIVARLDWTPNATADLDMALFQSGTNQPLVRSTNQGRQSETVRFDARGGLTYELRITYVGGTTGADYTVTLDCPN
jgi:hypothetical protein